MKKNTLTFLFLLLFTCLFGQLTITVSEIPSNTPASDKVYIAGNFNAWSPSATELVKKSDGSYSVTLNPNAGTVEYKYTRGTWASVEGNANGTFLANRKINYAGSAQSVDNKILTWEDKGISGGGTNPNSSAASNVKIIKTDFFMPQFNRYRRIWVCFPKDYDSNLTKKYPVMYLHDGQNLFDKTTSFSGEWKVDETLNTLFDQGDKGCIVVGIDNGGANRIAEYTPYVNAKYGGGDGEKYVDFLISTLKPYIDQNYRTLSDRENTGIGGSSLGGLISFYAAMKNQNVYGKALIFSPSFWWNNAIYSLVQTEGKKENMKIFLMAGGSEEADDDVVIKTQKMYDDLLAKGFSSSEIKFATHEDGQHSEWYWAREFGAAYKWLWSSTVSAKEAQIIDFQLFPNPATHFLTIQFSKKESVNAEIFGIDGKRYLSQTVQSNDRINISTLGKGQYFLVVKNGERKAFVVK